MLAGNLASIGVGGIIAVVMSLLVSLSAVPCCRFPHLHIET